MANNIDNNILQELEKVELEQFNQKIESEMNNILQESDCALKNAETQLNAIVDDVKNQSVDLFATNQVNKTDTLGPSLQITIKNDENSENRAKETLLNDASTFEGCSKEFASNVTEDKLTIVVDVEKGRLVSGNNILQETTNIIKTDVNSNNCQKTQKISLKRPTNETYASNVPVSKKLKFDECSNSKSNETNVFDYTQTEYTQVIFDPDETADANDPKWSEFNNNFASIDEHFESVRKQWRSMALPNPNKNLTMRFMPEDHRYKPETTSTDANTDYGSMPCVTYFDNKINRYTQKVNALYVRLKYLPQSNRGRSLRNKILREIDDLQKFVIEIVKNREEIQQNFMFYKHPNDAWNANYLTRSELDELKEQEKLLEFQKRFYSK